MNSSTFSMPKSLLGVAVSALVLVPVTGAWAATVTVNVTAKSLAPLVITKVVDLVFGNVVPSSTGGSLTMVPTVGSIQTTGGVKAIGNTRQMAHFLVTGTSGQHFSVTLPSAPVSVTSGTDSMTVTGFVMDAPNPRTANVSGVPIIVGATVNVGPDQPAGSYSGSYTISADYD